MAACGANITATDHPGMWLGAIMGTLAADAHDKVTIHTSPSIASFGSWVEQLIAESTGKEGKGLVPVVGATIGKPHDYSTDRLFIYLRVEGDDNDESDAGLMMLQQAGQPCVTLKLDDIYALGGEFFRWEFATAVVGKILDINPFDEPNVTESKNNTSRLLDYYKENGHLPETKPLIVAENAALYADGKMEQMLYDLCTQHQYEHNTLSGLIAAQLNATQAGDYFALLAYLPMTDEVDRQAGRNSAAAAPRHPAGGHARLRSALPAQHRTTAQGRSEQRRLLPVHAQGQLRPVDPGGALHLRRARGGTGSRRPRSAAKQESPRAAAAPRRRLDRRAATAPRRHRTGGRTAAVNHLIRTRRGRCACLASLVLPLH